MKNRMKFGNNLGNLFGKNSGSKNIFGPNSGNESGPNSDNSLSLHHGNKKNR